MGAPQPKIQIGRRSYRKFIPYPQEVRDGTVRCIFCGQIDEPEYHEGKYCPASPEWEDPSK
jgi:hypothetical protein